MTRIAIPLLLAFLAGTLLADGKDYSKVAAELVKRQATLQEDIERIVVARRDLLEVMETRADPRFILNKEEEKLERKSRTHLQIFMERMRNDTLETLALYDRTLDGKKVCLLERIYGKALNEVVEVSWEEADLEEIADDLIEGYGVKLLIKGNVDLRRTMSLEGEMSVAAIFEHIQNAFAVRLIEDDGEYWFTKDPTKTLPDE